MPEDTCAAEMSGLRRIRIEERCGLCGNGDDAEYRLYETEPRGTRRKVKIIGKQCVSCNTEWLPKEYIKNIPPRSAGTSPYLYQRNPPTDPKINVVRHKIDRKSSSCNVVEGNHITWLNEHGIWNHGIVAKITRDYGLGVIHWIEKDGVGIEVTKTYLPSVEDENSVYFRFEYPEETEQTNDLNLVLARAYSRTGDQKDGSLEDEALPFATFCKTGYEILPHVKSVSGKHGNDFIIYHLMSSAELVINLQVM